MPELSAELSSLLLRIVATVRQRGTWLVVGAIAVLATLALADALRGDGDDPAPAAPATTTTTTTTGAPPQSLPELLRTEAVNGFVIYSDEDCDLHSLLLPRLVDELVRDERGNAFQICRFDVEGGRIVAERARPHVGGLTVSGARILAGQRVVLSRRELLAAARRHPNIAGYDPGRPLDIRVTGLARLDADEVVVGLEISARYLEPQFLAALFRGSRVVTIAANFRGPYEHLVVSPGAAFVASEDGTLFTRDGRSLDARVLPSGKAVAFSPDERWLAYITGVSLYLIATPANDEPGRILRLPVEAQDLVWQPVTPATPAFPRAIR